MFWILLGCGVALLMALAANEISWQYTLTLTNPSTPPANGTSYTDKANDNLSLTQNTLLENKGVMSIPTTAGGTALPVGGVTTPGFLYLKNNDGTNYVQVGIVVSATFHAVGKLKPNESWVMRVDSGATIYLVANTAACSVSFMLLND